MYVDEQCATSIARIEHGEKQGIGKRHARLKITAAVFTMPLLARFPDGKHAKQGDAAGLGKGGNLFRVLGMAIRTLGVVSVFEFQGGLLDFVGRFFCLVSFLRLDNTIRFFRSEITFQVRP